ncbi:MAG: hypothetical protein L6Q98_10620 [Anaerolineae bacterium]|nr:hypothetical protein [Anaerolineae bacterium]NUQ02721.1 hypothetical protein [Anaerolineae bacterium]
MQPEQDLLNQGISAFQAGDREKARELLNHFVSQSPDNEQGWYYLAAVEQDAQLRKQHLERVLEINPGNVKAREVLDRIKAREANVMQGGAPAARTPSGMRPKIRALNPEDERRPGQADIAEEGFRLPFKIPGAPASVSPGGLARDGLALLRSGWNVLLRRPGDYAAEVDQATWWRFWLVTGTAATISAGVSLLLSLFIVIVTSANLFSFVSIILTPLLSIPLLVLALFLGCYASYRYAQAQGWKATLVRHSMTAGIVWAPTVVFTAAITLIFALLGFGGGYTGLIMLILAGYIMSSGYERLYLLTETKDKAALPLITLLVMLLAISLFRVILSSLVIGGALPFALF